MLDFLTNNKKKEKEYVLLLKTIDNKEEFLDKVMKDKQFIPSKKEFSDNSIKENYERISNFKQFLLQNMPNRDEIRYKEILTIISETLKTLYSISMTENYDERLKAWFTAEYEYYTFFKKFKSYLDDYDIFPDKRHLLTGI